MSCAHPGRGSYVRKTGNHRRVGRSLERLGAHSQLILVGGPRSHHQHRCADRAGSAKRVSVRASGAAAAAAAAASLSATEAAFPALAALRAFMTATTIATSAARMLMAVLAQPMTATTVPSRSWAIFQTPANAAKTKATTASSFPEWSIRWCRLSSWRCARARNIVPRPPMPTPINNNTAIDESLSRSV